MKTTRAPMKTTISHPSGQEWHQLSGHDFRLIEEFHFLTGKRDYCFPSREYLAAKLHITKWCVSRHTRKLMRLGLLRIQARRYRRRDGTWATRSNLYQLQKHIGRKVRQIMALLTGVRPGAHIPSPQKKSELSETPVAQVSEKKEEKRPPPRRDGPPERFGEILKRSAIYKKWLNGGKEGP